MSCERHPYRRTFAARSAALALLFLICASASLLSADSARPHKPKNLALHKPATSSSIENDEHNATQANDGDAETCWRADDEPEAGPEWWQVDLGQPFNLTGCEICWPYDGMKYRYKVEGSADAKNWTMLSDQTQRKSKTQFHRLKFDAAGIRYVKITITEVEEGCWASISEVKVFGS